MNAKQLTAAETIVMKCIWDADHEMSLAEIVKNANEGYGKEWKPQTVSTYLAFWNNGSLKQFITAFYKDEPASKDEIEELRNAIEELEE